MAKAEPLEKFRLLVLRKSFRQYLEIRNGLAESENGLPSRLRVIEAIDDREGPVLISIDVVGVSLRGPLVDFVKFVLIRHWRLGAKCEV